MPFQGPLTSLPSTSLSETSLSRFVSPWVGLILPAIHRSKATAQGQTQLPILTQRPKMPNVKVHHGKSSPSQKKSVETSAATVPVFLIITIQTWIQPFEFCLEVACHLLDTMQAIRVEGSAPC